MRSSHFSIIRFAPEGVAGKGGERVSVRIVYELVSCPSIALDLKTCYLGQSVPFKNVTALSTELCEARNRYRLGKPERALARIDLLILGAELLELQSLSARTSVPGRF